MADIKKLLTSASLIPLGFGIAIGSGFLFGLIELWPVFLLTGAGYCIYKGYFQQTNGLSGAKDAE